MIHAIEPHNMMVPIAMIGIFPLVMVIFAVMPARRAVITSLLLGWLFLPMGAYAIRSFPDFTKVTAATLPVLLGIIVFDAGRALTFRPKWYDLPLVLLILVPIASSLTNDLGLYDGVSLSFSYFLRWGVAYFIGRLYFDTLDGLRELLVGIFIGGLVYVPLCAIEVRMSPILHYHLYGWLQHSFVQQLRWGGYRPMIFMRHGLQVALWMSTATVVGFGLWQLGGMKKFMGVSMPLILLGLTLTLVLCKTISALMLFGAGITMIMAVVVLRSYWPIAAVATMPLIYVVIRASGLWAADELVTLAASTVGSERAQSLETRLMNENMLAEHASTRPIFGWGGWNRNRVKDEITEKDITTTDGMWIVIFGMHGATGLTLFVTVVLMPSFLLLSRIKSLSRPPIRGAPAIVSSVIIILWMVHNLPNNSINPIYMVMIGGLMACAGTRAHVRRRGPARSALETEETRNGQRYSR